MKNTTLLKIELLMSERGWSLYKLAKESDVPYSSLRNLFHRNTEPTITTLRKICKGLNITLAEFFVNEANLSENNLSKNQELILKFNSLKPAELQSLGIPYALFQFLSDAKNTSRNEPESVFGGSF